MSDDTAPLADWEIEVMGGMTPAQIAAQAPLPDWYYDLDGHDRRSAGPHPAVIAARDEMVSSLAGNPWGRGMVRAAFAVAAGYDDPEGALARAVRGAPEAGQYHDNCLDAFLEAARASVRAEAARLGLAPRGGRS